MRSLRASSVLRILVVAGALACIATHACLQQAAAAVAPTSTATITGTVLDPAGKPVPAAIVNLLGPRHSMTKTDTHGDFAFVGVPFGVYKVSVTVSDLGTATQENVMITGDTQIVIQFSSGANVKTIGRVVSIGNARFNVSPVSITLIHPQQLAFEGQTSWRSILDTIPGVSTGAANAVVDANSIPGSPWGMVLVSVNGALPYETAILLDNMPLVGAQTLWNSNGQGSGTDISLYPLNSFSTTDIIRGPSAAAPSIVNSVGGSVILRSPGQVAHDSGLLSVSNDAWGGYVTNATTSVRSGRISSVLSYGANWSPGPINKDAFETIFPFQVDGQAYSCSPPNCMFGTVLDPKYINFFGSIQSSVFACCVHTTSAWSQTGGSGSFRYDFSPRVSASFFYAGQQSKGMPTTAYFTDLFSPTAGYGGSLAPGTYQLPFNLSGYFQASSSSLTEEKIEAGIGASQLQFAALQNRTYSTEQNTPPESASLRLYGTGSLNGVPTVFNGGTYSVNNGIFTLESFQRGENRDIAFDWSTPISSASHVAASYVQSYFDAPTDTNETFGPPLIGFSFPVSDQNNQMTREVRLLFGGNPSKDTTLDVATYFANVHYHVLNPNNPTMSTFVNQSFTYIGPRTGFVWRPSANVAVRASAGGGFAPAPVNDLIGTNGAPFPNGSPPTSYSVTKTNLNVKPETSFAFDVGTDLRDNANTVYSLDVYRANLFGQVYQSTTLTGTFAGLPLFTTQFGNLGVSRYQGILLAVDHSVTVGPYWHLSGGLTRAYLVSLPAGFYDAGTCTNCANLFFVPGINFNGESEAAIPYSLASATFGYRWSKLFAELGGTYSGDSNSYLRPAFTVISAQAGADLTKNLRLLTTFDNINGIYDKSVQVLDPNDVTGAPTVFGPPYGLYPQEYGPRTVIVTLQLHV